MKEEESTIEITCRVCGEKLEAKNSLDIMMVALRHLQQSHKEIFDELEAKIAKVYEVKK